MKVMSKLPLAEKGIAQILIVVLLVIGLIAGLYLVQSKKIFKSRAYDPQQIQLLAVSSSNLRLGERYHVSWANIPNPTNSDLIALYKRGDPDNEQFQLAFATSSCGITLGKRAIRNGRCPVTVTERLTAGEYEYRFFSQGNFSQKLANVSLTISDTTRNPPPAPTSTPSTTTGNYPAPGGVNGHTCYSMIQRCNVSSGIGFQACYGAIQSERCVINQTTCTSCQASLPSARDRSSSVECKDGVCQPRSLSAQCAQGQLILSWDDFGTNADHYAIRVDDQSNGWSDQGAVLDGDTRQEDIRPPYLNRKALENRRYEWWVHAVSSDDKYSPLASGGIVQCPGFSPRTEGSICYFHQGFAVRTDNSTTEPYFCRGRIKDGYCQGGMPGSACDKSVVMPSN